MEEAEAKGIDLVEGPTYYPTEEDFRDPLRFIASIRDEAERYGIARVRIERLCR